MLNGESYKAALKDALGGLALAAVMWGAAIGTMATVEALLPLIR